MIYVIHGEDNVSSRNFILNLQKQNNVQSRVIFEVGKNEPGEISDAVSSIDMFGDKKLFVLDVSTLGRSSPTPYLNILEKIGEETLFIIFSSKELTKANKFVKFPKARVMGFKQAQKPNIFNFVDYVIEKNRIGAYKELRKLVLADENDIYIFTMLTNGIRNIAYSKFDSASFNKLPPFVKNKIIKQAAKYSEEEVTELYRRFYELDRDSKIGEFPHEVLVPMAMELVLS